MEEENNNIDSLIFKGADTAIGEKEEIYALFKDRISSFIGQGFEGDRAFLPQLEVMVAMLGTLSQKYYNGVVSPREVIDWKERTLRFFDAQTEAAGDRSTVTAWRRNIEANFERLLQALG